MDPNYTQVYTGGAAPIWATTSTTPRASGGSLTLGALQQAYNSMQSWQSYNSISTYYGTSSSAPYPFGIENIDPTIDFVEPELTEKEKLKLWLKNKILNQPPK